MRQFDVGPWVNDRNKKRPVVVCAYCGLFLLVEAMMTEKKTDSRSIRTSHLEDIEVVLELWRQADADIPMDKAAIALSCHPETMEKHYVVQDRMAIAGEVLARIQN